MKENWEEKSLKGGCLTLKVRNKIKPPKDTSSLLAISSNGFIIL
jgi:hypothetical protein